MTLTALAVKATVDTDKLPGLPDGAKDALAPILGTPLFWWGLFGLILLGLYLSGRTNRLTKLIALGAMALIVVGWDSQRGVLTAAMGSQDGANTALLVVLVVGGLWAVFRGPSGRTANGSSIRIPGFGRRKGH